MLKHLGDFMNEDHHCPIRWAKKFFFGFIVGGMFGAPYVFFKPEHPIVNAKMTTYLGSRIYSGKQWRFTKAALLPCMLYGASINLGYELLITAFRFKEKTTARPLVIDHMFACTILTSYSFMLYYNCPIWAFKGLFFGFLGVGPALWNYKKVALMNSAEQHPNIFYKDGVTDEEIERIQMTDNIESIAHEMMMQPGFGIIKLKKGSI